MLTLKCPRCRKDLVGESYAGVSLDRCLECGASWLGHDRLRTMLNRQARIMTRREATRLRRLQDRLSKQGEKREPFTPCPRCGRSMEHWVYRQSRVVLDRCPAHGTWFDEGELEHAQLAADRCDELKPAEPRPARSGAEIVGRAPRRGSPLPFVPPGDPAEEHRLLRFMQATFPEGAGFLEPRGARRR